MRVAALSAAAVMAGSALAVDCSKGLHIIVGRGTDEPAGLGVTGVLAKNITAAIPGSDVVPIDYPASVSNPSYDASEKQGAQNVYDQVTQYHADCPGHKMAYLGYSQGAQIGVNAFCGGQGGIFGTKDAIPADAVKDVVAIAIFGDPSFNHTAPYVKGTSSTDGLFVRNGLGACANFTSKIVSYCDTGDVYCSSGANRTVHGLYLVKYPEELKQFVIDHYNKDTSSASGTNSTGGNSTTTSASPTASSTSTSKPSSSASATPKPNAAAEFSASGLMVALPVAMVAAAQMLL